MQLSVGWIGNKINGESIFKRANCEECLCECHSQSVSVCVWRVRKNGKEKRVNGTVNQVVLFNLPSPHIQHDPLCLEFIQQQDAGEISYSFLLEEKVDWRKLETI